MAPPTTVPGCWPCTNVSSRASLASTRTSLEHASSRLHSGRFPTRHPHPPSHLLHIVLLLTLHLISFTLSFSSPSISSPSHCPSPHPPSHLLHLVLLLTLHLISFTLPFSSPSISSPSPCPSPHPPSHLFHIVLLLTLHLISFTSSFSSPSFSSPSHSPSPHPPFHHGQQAVHGNSKKNHSQRNTHAGCFPMLRRQGFLKGSLSRVGISQK